MTNDPRQLSNFYSAWASAADTDGAVSWARKTEGDEGSTERNRKNGGEKQDKQVKRKKKIKYRNNKCILKASEIEINKSTQSKIVKRQKKQQKNTE